MDITPTEPHALPGGPLRDVSPLNPAGTWSKTDSRTGQTVLLTIHQHDGLVPVTNEAAAALRIPIPHHPTHGPSTVMWWPLEMVREALRQDGWEVRA